MGHFWTTSKRSHFVQFIQQTYFQNAHFWWPICQYFGKKKLRKWVNFGPRVNDPISFNSPNRPIFKMPIFGVQFTNFLVKQFQNWVIFGPRPSESIPTNWFNRPIFKMPIFGVQFTNILVKERSNRFHLFHLKWVNYYQNGHVAEPIGNNIRWCTGHRNQSTRIQFDELNSLENGPCFRNPCGQLLAPAITIRKQKWSSQGEWKVSTNRLIFDPIIQNPILGLTLTCN